MKTVGYIFAGLLVLLGLLFCLSALSSGKWQRFVFAGVLMGAGGFVIYILRMRVPEQKITLTQKIDISGDVKLEELKCRNCGGVLDARSVSVQAGAVFVKCPYCDSQYQIEEAPKW
jgi:phage FluMu protein Com